MAGTYKHTKIEAESVSGADKYIPTGASRPGTVTTVVSSKKVVGVGTSFCQLIEGSSIIIDGDYKVVVSEIIDDETLYLKEAATELKSGTSFTSVEFKALEISAIFTTGGTIEGKAWSDNVSWTMKNDYGIEPVLFNGTGTVTYLTASDNH